MAWQWKKSAEFNGSTNTSVWSWKHVVTEYWETDSNNSNYYLTKNVSIVRVTSYLGRPTSASYFGGVATCRLDAEKDYNYKIDSKTFSYPTKVAKGGWVQMHSYDFVVEHNNDGTKTITTYSSLYNSEFNPSSASAQGNFTLTTIPRETDLPAFASAEVEKSSTITLSPKISGATHSIKLVFGNLTNWLKADGSLGTSEVKLSGKSLPITIPTSYYEQFDGASKTGTLYLYTYNGNTKIGSGKSKSFKITCNQGLCTPSISATVKDTNSITVALTGDEKTVVANASNILITPIIQGSDTDDTKGYITSKKVNEKAFTTDTYTEPNATTKDFEIYVANSRGFSNVKTVSMNRIVPYVPLTFSADNLYRPEPTTGEIVLEYSGKYYPGEFTNNLGDNGVFNTLDISWEYKPKSSDTYIEGGVLTPTINVEKNTYSGELTLGSNFDYKQQYDFVFYYNDKIINKSLKKSVTRGLPIFWWSEDAVHIVGNLYVEGEINPN